METDTESSIFGRLTTLSRIGLGILLGLLFVLCASKTKTMLAQSPGPYMVKDITTLPTQNAFYGPYGPPCLTAINDILFLNPHDGIHGAELWRSDGTPEGTFMLKDLLPGPLTGSPCYVVAMNNAFFFTSVTWESTGMVNALWKSDGTSAGTQVVRSWRYTPNPPSWFWSRQLVVNNKLFFTAWTGNDGSEMFDELWVSDGTFAGTRPITAMWNNGSVSRSIANLTNLNGTLFFTARRDDAYELWKSDGTLEGTVLVKDVWPYDTEMGLNIGFLNPLNNKLVFLADDGSDLGLWQSDGTSAGTVLVKSFSVSDYLYYRSLGTTRIDNTLFLVLGTTSAPAQLWKSDGTTAGTTVIKEFSPDAWLYSLTAGSGRVFFAVDDGSGAKALWRSDGSTAGTTLVKDGFTSLGGLTDVNGVLFFVGGDALYGNELWKSDGTSTGTTLVKDIASGINGSSLSALTRMGNHLFFVADDGLHGVELWRSDGTAAGTYLVRDINTETGMPSQFVATPNQLFFTADDGIHGAELWRSDGTLAGTTLVRDIYPGSTGASIYYAVALGDTLFFNADDGVHGAELWKSDGTPTGTVLVRDIDPGGSSSPTRLTPVGDTLFFTANGPLWKSDGTLTNTVLVTPTVWPDFLMPARDTLFLWVQGNETRYELWQSDGTSAGTRMVKDGFGSNIAWRYAVLGDVFLFSADDVTYGYSLWRSDGTTAGTFMLKDIIPATLPYEYLDHFTVAGNTLFFAANDGEHGVELWQSDGTMTGTVMVKDIDPRQTCNESYQRPGSGTYPCSSDPRNLSGMGDYIFFSASDGEQGVAIWQSDGVEAGTVMLRSGFTSGIGGTIGAIAAANGHVLFVGDDGIRGMELWQSDVGGSMITTFPVKDIYPGSGGAFSPPSRHPLLTFVGDTLFFRANDSVHGTELWAYRPTIINVSRVFLPLVMRYR